MSSTRTAQPGSPLRQERFASSPEFERGLKANLVAKRAELLESAEDRELIWWIQHESHEPGGLNALVDELVNRNPEAHITPQMREYGFGPDAKWTGAQAWDVCRRAMHETYPFHFLENRQDFEGEHDAGKHENFRAARVVATNLGRARDQIPSHLEEVCLNPSIWVSNDGPRCFYGLRDALFALMRQKIGERRGSRVVTTIGLKVDEAFRFAWKTRGLVIVNGNPRIGKTHAARAWCDEHPGIARFAQVPSASDELSFLRAIAISLGISLPLKAKTTDLRVRIEDVLQSRQLLLCLDESHYLFPHSNYREALPQRVNWLMTALINHRVPVVLIVTPQFFSHQKRVEEKTTWTGGQFTGRVKRYFELPDVLPQGDLAAVARHLLPSAGQKIIDVLAHVASVSGKHLAAIESVVDTARFMAEEDGREDVAEADIRQAIQEVMPSDRALAEAVKGPAIPSRRRGRKMAVILPGPGSDSADDLPLPSSQAARQTSPGPFSLPANHRREDVTVGG
jgi:hypothetical protein